jgi:hypothetical protein
VTHTTINGLDALRARLDATPDNLVPVHRVTLLVVIEELATLRSMQAPRICAGDLDDLQGFIDVVEDGTVTPDDIDVAREALGALHRHLKGNAP